MKEQPMAEASPEILAAARRIRLLILDAGG